jgi:hypothetical protein
MFEVIRKFWIEKVEPLCKQIAEEIGPEQYTEIKLGKLESLRAVDGGGFMSNPKTEVTVEGIKYLVNQSMSGLKSGVEVLHRHWQNTHPYA